MKVEIRRSVNYQEAVAKCYATDAELLEKYHVIAPTNLTDAVNDTVDTFLQARDISNFRFYEIYKDGELISYFGTGVHKNIPMLIGYFIVPKYRREFALQFMRIVKSKLPPTFFSAVYEKNQRAEKFLKRNNFKPYGTHFAPERGMNMLIYKHN